MSWPRHWIIGTGNNWYRKWWLLMDRLDYASNNRTQDKRPHHHYLLQIFWTSLGVGHYATNICTQNKRPHHHFLLQISWTSLGVGQYTTDNSTQYKQPRTSSFFCSKYPEPVLELELDINYGRPFFFRQKAVKVYLQDPDTSSSSPRRVTCVTPFVSWEREAVRPGLVIGLLVRAAVCSSVCLDPLSARLCLDWASQKITEATSARTNCLQKQFFLTHHFE